MKTIYLVGAPLSSHLDWERDSLLHDPIPPFETADTIPHSDIQSGQLEQQARWRLLQARQVPGLHISHIDVCAGPGDPSFLRTHQLIQGEDGSLADDSVLSAFLDHSFVTHETSGFSISQMEDSSTQESKSLLDDDDDDDDDDHPIVTAPRVAEKEAKPHPPLPVAGPIRDLRNVPSATYLQSIMPRTMTVNLVVGVIAIHSPRRVVTRPRQTDMDIVEMIVGDETRTGFGVNLWLTVATAHLKTSSATPQADHVRRALAMLRPRDIVLLRNVGLGSFGEQVYGQSLRGGMTRVELLSRQPVDATDLVGIVTADQLLPRLSQHDPPPHCQVDPLLRKVSRVRHWIRQFVGEPVSEGGGCTGMSRIQRGFLRLPPDTQ
ncbi:hypothetical protein N7539_006162 [Penicillium diatomitis]|uniref:Uncharacterized protein n=1 Tax=Penicillium diatomitis TaxID=2819901 RepID=A0A9W9X2N2_9EURO|nr:uncharacterized protein N7539_006162 [Penicillium diatomitis]KAJ5482716.1 hypothetical protein N7539_006162 [Penicillium diatomitis]